MDGEKIIIFSAPSGAGKTTIVRAVLKRFPELAFSVSATTRSPRPYEIHGKDYYFITVAEFERLLCENAFVEWQEVYPGLFYGTLASEVIRLQGLGKVPVFDLDVYGGVNLKDTYGQKALSIFIEPPSLEVLRDRLITRGTEDKATLSKRLAKATVELTFATRFDIVVVNNRLEEAIAEVIGHIQQFIGCTNN